MTLLRLVQRASILAGMTFASLAVHSSSVHADTPQFCAVTSNGQTACGTLKTIERLCVTTDGTNTICGKFKSFKPAGQEASTPITPLQRTVARKEVNNIVFALRGCRKSDTNVKCELTITNKGSQKKIAFLAGRSDFIDFAGKTHQGSTGDLGGTANPFTQIVVTPSVDYSASITFENVPDQVVKAQLLNLSFDVGMVQFRNVSFSN